MPPIRGKMATNTAPLGTLSALGSALLLRKRPLRRLMQNPALPRRLAISVPVLFLSILTVQPFSSKAADFSVLLLSAFGTAFAQTVFWLIILFAVAEPVFDLLLRSATFDEAELQN